MTSFFFYGTLRHAPLLEAVLGRVVATEPAELPDHAVLAVQGHDFALIVPQPGARAEGVVAHDLTTADVERMDYYAAAFGAQMRQVAVAGRVLQVWFAQPGLWQPAGAWDLEPWVQRHAALQIVAAREAMALRHCRPAAELAARWPKIQVRASSRLRARGEDATAEARLIDPSLQVPSAQDVAVLARREPYANYFSVEEFDLGYRRYDGKISDTVNRAVFITGDAATVLPYDPVRDRVLVIEQFRVGPYARGDGQPWLLEPIAGRVDANEGPEAAIRREAQEEAGLDLGEIFAIGSYYPTPAAKSEFLYSYVGIADLADGVAGIGGLDEETEDIRAHILPFDRLIELVDGGELSNGPLLLSAHWLARNRERLRASARAGA